jgi:hypothetical protein
MAWYYAVHNEQKGPVEQSEFDRLVQQGVITGTTLVWREGMANWQPCDEVAVLPGTPSPVGAGLGGLVCSECGRAFAADQVIQVGHRYVCAACKPIAVQKLREGVADSGAEQIRKDHIKHEASVKSRSSKKRRTSSIERRSRFGFSSACCCC